MTIVYYIVFLAITLVVLCFVLLLYITVKRFDTKGICIHWISRLWVRISLVLQFGWKVKVEGLEHIERSGVYVIIVNHQSVIDIPLMYSIPLNFKWVAKEEVCKVPIFGWMMKMHGDITVKRGSANAVRKFISEGGRCIKGGVSIIIFPEGTRSKEGNIRKFKEGAFILAKYAEASILPCVIDGSGDAIINYSKFCFTTNLFLHI